MVKKLSEGIYTHTHAVPVHPVHGEKECKIHDGAAFVTKWTLSYLCTVHRQSGRRNFSCYNHTWIEQFQDIFAFAKNIPAKRPKTMLQKFSTLTGTLNSKIPATEMGILFKEPTRLYVVGPV